MLPVVTCGDRDVEEVLEGGERFAAAADQETEVVRDGIIGIIGAVDIEHLCCQAGAVACGLGVAGRDLGVGEAEQREQVAQHAAAEVDLVLGVLGGSGGRIVGSAGNCGGRTGCLARWSRSSGGSGASLIAVTTTATAATAATAAGATADWFAALAGGGGCGLPGGDADDRFLGAEAEEAALTFANDVDVDLIAVEA